MGTRWSFQRVARLVEERGGRLHRGRVDQRSKLNHAPGRGRDPRHPWQPPRAGTHAPRLTVVGYNVQDSYGWRSYRTLAEVVEQLDEIGQCPAVPAHREQTSEEILDGVFHDYAAAWQRLAAL